MTIYGRISGATYSTCSWARVFAQYRLLLEPIPAIYMGRSSASLTLSSFLSSLRSSSSEPTSALIKTMARGIVWIPTSENRTCAIHSKVKLIFLAASILTQLTQRPFPEGNSIEKTAPPHFLHLAGTIITTYFMIVGCVASYKEETKRLVFANQSSQNGLSFTVGRPPAIARRFK